MTNESFGEMFSSNTKLPIVIEGTDTAKFMLISQAITGSVAKTAVKVSNTSSPLTVDLTALYGTGLDFTNLFMHRFMALFAFLFSLIITMTSLFQDKTTKIFQKRAASPIKASLAYTLGLCIFGFIASLIVLAHIIYIMGLSVVGGALGAILLMFLISLVGTSLGVLFNSVTRNRIQTYILLGIIITLQIIFGGLFIPVSKFDAFNQLISYGLPLTYALDAMQSIVIRGFPLTDLGTDIIALFVFIVVILIISILGFRFVQKSSSSIDNCLN